MYITVACTNFRYLADGVVPGTTGGVTFVPLLRLLRAISPHPRRVLVDHVHVSRLPRPPGHAPRHLRPRPRGTVVRGEQLLLLRGSRGHLGRVGSTRSLRVDEVFHPPRNGHLVQTCCLPYPKMAFKDETLTQFISQRKLSSRVLLRNIIP